MKFITGATGFLGSYVLYYLLDEEDPNSIIALKRTTSSFDQLNSIFRFLDKQYQTHQQDKLDQVQWINGNLNDINTVDHVLEQVDTIYHTAAKVSYDPKDRDAIISVNVDGTKNLIDLAVKNNIEHFYYVSSVASLNKKAGVPTTEDFISFKRDFSSTYAESKFRAEMEVWRGFAEGLQGVIVNPGVIIGPGDFNSGSPRIFKTIHEGLRFYPSGSSALVDARDVAQSFIRLTKDPSSYNNRYIQVAETMPLKKMLSHIAYHLNAPKPKYQVNLPLSLTLAYIEKLRSLISGSTPFITPAIAKNSNTVQYYDNSKIKDQLNLEFRNVADSIRATCEFFLNQQASKTAN